MRAPRKSQFQHAQAIYKMIIQRILPKFSVPNPIHVRLENDNYYLFNDSKTIVFTIPM
jgi:hypothetical protein